MGKVVVLVVVVLVVVQRDAALDLERHIRILGKAREVHRGGVSARWPYTFW